MHEKNVWYFVNLVKSLRGTDSLEKVYLKEAIFFRGSTHLSRRLLSFFDIHILLSPDPLYGRLFYYFFPLKTLYEHKPWTVSSKEIKFINYNDLEKSERQIHVSICKYTDTQGWEHRVLVSENNFLVLFWTVLYCVGTLSAIVRTKVQMRLDETEFGEFVNRWLTADDSRWFSQFILNLWFRGAK